MIKMTSPKTSQERVTEKWNKFARAWFPKYVVLHRKGAGNEAEECATVGSLEPFSGQALDETVPSRTE